MKTLNIPLLRTFVAFADCGSCQSVAEAMHKTPAAISTQLKQLEQLAGKTLFEKKGRNLQLTKQGQRLLPYARQIMRLHNQALAAFEPDEFSETVRVGLPDDYISVLLNPLLRAFGSALPKAQIELHCAPSAVLRPMLAKNALDVSILSCKADAQEGQVLCREQAHWVAPADYKHCEDEVLKLLLFPEGCILRSWALEALRSRNIEYEVACTSHNMQALKIAMSNGLGVMLATESNIPDDCSVLTGKPGFPELPQVTVSLSPGIYADHRIIEPLYQAIRDQGQWGLAKSHGI